MPAVYGCGKGSVTEPALSFDPTTGIGDIAQTSRASDRGCPSGPAYETANGSSNVLFIGANFTTTAGHHRVVSHWIIDWRMRVSEIANGSPSPPAACVVFSLSTYLMGLHGRTFGQGSNAWDPGALCTNLGNLTVSAVSHVALVTNATLLAGHTYFLVANMSVFTGVYISAMGTSATASFNAGTSGHFARLVSVQVY